MSSKTPPVSVTDSLMRLIFFMAGSVNNEQGICRSNIVKLSNRHELFYDYCSKKTINSMKFSSYENCVRGLKVGFEQVIGTTKYIFRTTI